MLTRAFAFKGPPDHLSRVFDIRLLYQGMQLLLDDLLVDWQYERGASHLTGVFIHADGLIKTRLCWPLANQSEINWCDCHVTATATEESRADCEHLAALAIETKMRLDRLPQPVKPSDTHSNDWHYLEHWLEQQRFDPYPNMARHRVVYLLDADEQVFSVSLHKAYLNPQNQFSLKALLDPSLVKREKLPKFVSLTDQQILDGVNQLAMQISEFRRERHRLPLGCGDIDKGQALKIAELLELMARSGRLFWRHCQRQPLGFANKVHAQPDWQRIGSKVYLDRANGRLVKLKRSEHPATGPFLCDKHFNPDDWQAFIEIGSPVIEFLWHDQVTMLDVARVYFCDKKHKISLNDLRNFSAENGREVSPQAQAFFALHLRQLDWVPSVHSNFENPVAQHFDIADRWLEGDLAHWLPLFRALQGEGWNIRFGADFRLNQKSIERWYGQVFGQNDKKLKKDADKPGANSEYATDPESWFELEVGVMVEGKRVNVMPHIVAAIRRGRQTATGVAGTLNAATLRKGDLQITLDDGTPVILPQERIDKILAVLVELFEPKSLNDANRLRLPASQYSRLLSLQQQVDGDLRWQQADWLRQKASRLQQGKGLVAVEVPPQVNATLRDYQKRGLDWLQFLTRENLGGILADDMGLGKTLQALAHIQCEKNAARMQGPCLVVVPTSLLGNWQTEAQRFTPQLKTLHWAGSQRKKQRHHLSKVDLIITSYGVLLRDFDLFHQLKIHLLILDEAQAIKNSRSKVATIACSLSAKHRLCLTGTPLENHLGELWSLFHFLMPGFLGQQLQFERLFRHPIEKEQDASRQKELAARIAPFMLRRSKDKVARDLPSKTIIEEVIELEQEQADIYEAVRLSMLQEVQKAVAQSGAGANRLLIGNALLRLRQICCHPQLIGKSFEGFASLATDSNEVEMGKTGSMPSGSAKLSWLSAVLPEMIENGRRILIFSSFTSMLDLVAQLLQRLSINYLTLTGKSKHRQRLIESFQAGEAPVFLISLKAGGAGLNLTRADSVIHIDPWWNPAAEDQASDRAHRIGQDKSVFVYKLIAKGTVEEKIIRLQKHKSELASELYSSSGEQSEFTQPDWQLLLAPLASD